MLKKVIVISFDEIFTKSEKVSKKLLNLIEKQLKEKGIKILERKRFKFFLEYSQENLDKLKKIFGIKVIYLGFCFDNYEELIKFLKTNINNFINEKTTFKIITKRHWKKFEKNSLEISKEIGELIVKLTNAKVDLKNSEKLFLIEIYKNKTTFFYEKINGLGGVPLNSQPKTLCLFSGGIDSPVASFLIAKRGSNQDFLFFNSSDLFYLSKVIKPFLVIREYLKTPKFFVLNISKYIKEFQKIRKGYRQLALKWFFYKVAEEFCKKNKYKAIITGENLAQVSTQTIYSLDILNKITDLLILRPLLTFDKSEIKEIAQKIKTLEFSEKVDELCTIENSSIPFPNKKIFFDEIKKLNFDFSEIIKEIKEIKEEEIKQLINYEENLINKLKQTSFIYFEIKENTNLNQIKQKILENKEKTIILYCEKGRKSFLVKQELIKQLKNLDIIALDKKTFEKIKKLI